MLYDVFGFYSLNHTYFIAVKELVNQGLKHDSFEVNLKAKNINITDGVLLKVTRLITVLFIEVILIEVCTSC